MNIELSKMTGEYGDFNQFAILVKFINNQEVAKFKRFLLEIEKVFNKYEINDEDYRYILSEFEQIILNMETIIEGNQKSIN